MFSKVAQKVNMYLGNSSEKYVTKNVKKLLNLVTLLLVNALRAIVREEDPFLTKLHFTVMGYFTECDYKSLCV